MKKYFIVAASFAWCMVQAQPTKKNTQQPSRSEVNKMMEDAMSQLPPDQKDMVKQMMNGGMSATGTGSNKLVPDKQTALLAKIPRLTSEAQYTSFILKLKQQAEKNINPSIIAAVKKIIENHKNDKTAINNLPVLLLMQKQVEAAVYASLVGSQQNRDILLSQNNLGFSLQQAGYPQYALPVFEYLLTKKPNAILYNNAGQCYFSLGDTAKARYMFAACIRIDPDNAEAHCGMAFILLEAQKIHDAIPHIAKALQNGYSGELDNVVTKKNIQLKFDDIKKKNVPDYFSPQKYKIVPPAKNLKEVLTRWPELQQLEQQEQRWASQDIQANEALQSKMNNWMMQRVMGSKMGPFKRKAALMSFVIQQEALNNGATSLSEVAQAKTDVAAAIKKMEASIRETAVGNITSYEVCKIKERFLNEYLLATIPMQESIERNYNYKYFDYINQLMYWYKFLLTPEEYNAAHYHMGNQLMSWVNKVSNVQKIYPEPLNIAVNCDKILDNPPKEDEMQQADGECPVTVKIPFGFGSVKFNCEGWEIEATEIVALSVEKNYKTGDFTVAFGLGASAEFEAFEAGAKGQLYFTIDKDWTASDMGLRGEIKGEVNTGLNPVEEGVKGAIGISGVNANAIHAGKEINIFSYDPTK